MAEEQLKLRATYLLPGAAKGIYKKVHIKWGHSPEECLIGATLEYPWLKKWQLLGEHCPPLTEVPGQAHWYKLLKDLAASVSGSYLCSGTFNTS